MLLCFNQRMTHLLRVLPLHLAGAALAEFDKMPTAKVLAVMDVPDLVQGDFASRVHRMRGLPLDLSGGGTRLVACEHVRVSRWYWSLQTSTLMCWRVRVMSASRQTGISWRTILGSTQEC